ncbi:tRNA pseudouridine(38-40) synthase TruA [Mucilaginibacter flavus]|uniref:tRNA pseudouridine(38-40) synthase TruA n=1 Tax=Mucilaginibacter flavus TaxID=931504 RepID=UPI0025B40921|nr:tRNA pseudouridine(38-40) synthase TruA [Mucilaginibacter flavus]MDN3580166.1 tRNA pseudouridine(38-40) synthase TruA [Mucilaginibacter flavus]
MTNKQRYFIELAYDGTNYHGWQIQQNAVSVQEVLNKALATIFRQPIETTGCGRTDTGVHAKEFFAHFDVEEEVHGSLFTDHGKEEVHGSLFIDHSKKRDVVSAASAMNHELLTMNQQHQLKNKVRGLNSILPADIAIKNLIPVHADAHARFDATLRSYQYHVHFNKDPFLQGGSWMLRDVPDIELMNQAAAMMMDYIDFSCFSKSNTQVKTNNCKISRAEWVLTEQGMVFHISADRFLRNMVRAIVGTLMMVGKKEIPPEAVKDIIESKNRSNAGMSVPACGLYLTQISYPYLSGSK